MRLSLLRFFPLDDEDGEKNVAADAQNNNKPLALLFSLG